MSHVFQSRFDLQFPIPYLCFWSLLQIEIDPAVRLFGVDLLLLRLDIFEIAGYTLSEVLLVLLFLFSNLKKRHDVSVRLASFSQLSLIRDLHINSQDFCEH